MHAGLTFPRGFHLLPRNLFSLTSQMFQADDTLRSADKFPEKSSWQQLRSPHSPAQGSTCDSQLGPQTSPLGLTKIHAVLAESQKTVTEQNAGLTTCHNESHTVR